MSNNKRHLKFSDNWNYKLYCKCWTTLRLWLPERYVQGQLYDVYLKDEYLGQAELVGMRKTKSSSINEFVGRLDTGYSAAETKKIIQRMYKTKMDPEMGFYLFKWHKRHPGSSIDLSLLKDIKHVS